VGKAEQHKKTRARIFFGTGKESSPEQMPQKKRYKAVIRQFVRKAQERYSGRIEKIILLRCFFRG